MPSYTGERTPDNAPGLADLRPLTVEELADLTGWTAAAIWRMARRGELPSIRVNRRLFFPRPAVLRLLTEGGPAVREEGAHHA